MCSIFYPSVFEQLEQIMSKYQSREEDDGLTLSKERQKLLDMQIGLTLIGQQGRELMAKRIRIITDKYKKNAEKSFTDKL